jgi:nucleoside-diphosphate-sugar epimerase
VTSPTRVLVTGHRGYIGSVLAPYFVSQGYEVLGLDTGYFSDCTLVPDPTSIPELQKDLRDVVPADLRGVDAIVHLGALSNDPIGNLDERWTEEINHEATMRLAELARAAGIRRFLFSSSCIMYGMAATEVVDETAALDPKTVYARSKVKSERGLAELVDDDFSPTFLRNGTIYGLSPRMRFDTVLNDLCGAAFTTGKIVVRGDGKPWRPVVHVEDVARAFQTVLDAPLELVHGQAINLGAEQLNHQVIELAELAAAVVPGCAIEVLASPGADQRTYRADFGKFARTFPRFKWRWDGRAGAADLVARVAQIGLTHDQYAGSRFVRLRWLDHLRESGRLDDSLRWTAAREAA